MDTIKSTDIRKEFSAAIDTVIRNKPLFVKRTRDYMVMTESGMMLALLETYAFSAKSLLEEDGSITLSLNEIDLAVNAPDEKSAKRQLAADILEYAEDYYEQFDKWYHSPNRKPHMPYVLKALLLNDVNKIEGQIQCLVEEN